MSAVSDEIRRSSSDSEELSDRDSMVQGRFSLYINCSVLAVFDTKVGEGAGIAALNL